MGNYISCTLATPLVRTSKASRVIFPGGEIKQFRQPMKAAELMLECPNFFLTNAASLHSGRRFSALSADEELELGNVYVMFPMKRVSSVVTAADMAVFFMATNSAARRISGGNNKVRVLPESVGDNNVLASHRRSDEESGPRLNLEGVEGFLAPESQYRLSVCRSRKPNLETIKEEPVR
ncbi:hypothetical protein K2173_010036 [Erythroxylum novogranatense]|uniref:Uncharacterized protein n=1 Tax=Erythroxylum novogranatense TaxID=1862640 RepID=A0AAV8TV35_9ROSI|nr:hypothetical protein K2173_010036 [Erythroxylum novogranatense]